MRQKNRPAVFPGHGLSFLYLIFLILSFLLLLCRQTRQRSLESHLGPKHIQLRLVILQPAFRPDPGFLGPLHIDLLRPLYNLSHDGDLLSQNLDKACMEGCPSDAGGLVDL